MWGGVGHHPGTLNNQLGRNRDPMSARLRLKLDNLPTFETSPLFCALPRAMELALKSLPHVATRAIASLRFRQRMGRPQTGVSEDHAPVMEVAYLRAALMEYVAMEEVLPADLAARGKGEIPLKIVDTENAMLIILRELRHLQLHVVNSVFLSESKAAVLRGFGRELETEVTIETVPMEELMRIKELRNASRYDGAELDAAIEWFSRTQTQWGIGDVVQAGVQRYAELLIQEYELDAS